MELAIILMEVMERPEHFSLAATNRDLGGRSDGISIPG